MSLFDLAPDKNEFMSSENLKIVKAEFIEKKNVGWEDLFTGYDEMYGITFSSGIQFMEKVFDSFEHVEMIFGCEGVLNDDIAAIISAQIKSVEAIVSDGNIWGKIQKRLIVIMIKS